MVDTGGEVISISTSTAESLNVSMPRKIGLKVYGTSGWDREAFLMPGVNLKFDDIAYPNFSVVVLNLRAPSVLLGFEVGGIVGHKFLSPYRVSLDLERSEMRMTKAGTRTRVRSRTRCRSCRLGGCDASSTAVAPSELRSAASPS